MTKVEQLLMQWKAGSIKDPTLSLLLNYIHKLQLDMHERESKTVERTDPILREDDNSKPKRLKAKGL